MPDIRLVPIFTPIPFKCNIVTMSKPMQRGDGTAEVETIFPAPPSKPQDIDFRLVRHVFLRANTWTENGNGKLASLGGLGSGGVPSEHLAVQLLDKVWVPESGDEKKQKGRWKQEVEIQSVFTLTCAPSFATDTMKVDVSDRACRDLYCFKVADNVYPVSISSEYSFPRHREQCQRRNSHHSCF